MAIEEPWNAPPPSKARTWEEESGPAREKRRPSDKSRVVAGVLAILLPGFGAHKFYLGYRREGAIMLIASTLGGILTCGIASWALAVIGLVEGIIYLVKSDADFRRIYVDGRRGWF